MTRGQALAGLRTVAERFDTTYRSPTVSKLRTTSQSPLLLPGSHHWRSGVRGYRPVLRRAASGGLPGVIDRLRQRRRLLLARASARKRRWPRVSRSAPAEADCYSNCWWRAWLSRCWCRMRIGDGAGDRRATLAPRTADSHPDPYPDSAGLASGPVCRALCRGDVACGLLPAWQASKESSHRTCTAKGKCGGAGLW